MLKACHTKRKSFFQVLIIIAHCSTLAFTACTRKAGLESAGSKVEDTTAFTERLSIIRHDSFQVVEIRNPWQGSEGVSHSYILLKEGMPVPQGYNESEIIPVPVRKVVCMSTTHVAMVAALGEEGSIAGISGSRYVCSPSVRELISSDSILEVGYENSLNNELLLRISPDLIIMYGIGNETAGQVAKLRDMGFRVIVNADYLETEPLKKLEWLRLFGALYCREYLADSLVNSEKAAYYRIFSYTDSATATRPGVMLGLPFNDSWYISPGNSFAARFVKDAGGKYLWEDYISDITVPMSLESVFLRALKADYWLNPGSADNRNEIIATDQRLGGLSCYSEGRIFNNNRKMSPGGGNDYWESGSVHPSVILKDIASILHPGLYPGYEPVYYKVIK
jgi:iron complex transport system substrate-binding protein